MKGTFQNLFLQRSLRTWCGSVLRRKVHDGSARRGRVTPRGPGARVRERGQRPRLGGRHEQKRYANSQKHPGPRCKAHQRSAGSPRSLSLRYRLFCKISTNSSYLVRWHIHYAHILFGARGCASTEVYVVWLPSFGTSCAGDTVSPLCLQRRTV